MKTGCKRIDEDRLMFASVDDRGRYIRQGKRVGKDCPLAWDERRMYVRLGLCKATEYVAANRGISNGEARILMDRARKGVRHEDRVR